MFTQQGMRGLLERHDTVVAQAIDPAPDGDVAVLQQYTAALVAPLKAAEQKDGRDAERYRDNRSRVIALVPVAGGEVAVRGVAGRFGCGALMVLCSGVGDIG